MVADLICDTVLGHVFSLQVFRIFRQKDPQLVKTLIDNKESIRRRQRCGIILHERSDQERQDWDTSSGPDVS